MMPKLVAALAIVTLTFGAQRASAQQPARVDGVLTDSTHNKPLSDAIIYINRIEPAQPELMR